MNYRCWFLINQNIEKREFEEIEKDASSRFVDFINRKNYGKGIELFRFDIYVNEEINFGLHNDSVYTGSAHLSAHVDSEKFINSDYDNKIKLLLNAALVLIEYLKDYVVIPKDSNINELFADYDNYLKSENIKLSDKEINEFVIKVFNTTKFRFHITTTWEVKDSEMHYDLNDIEDFINNKLSGKTFGKSIQKFDLGYEIFDFKGDFKDFRKETKDLKRYGTKHKNLLIVKQFDYGRMKGLTENQQYDVLENAILEAIKDVDSMKRKPKDFNRNVFYEEMSTILDEYRKHRAQQCV